MTNQSSTWLVGAGPMAQQYAKVLVDQAIPFRVIGRSEASAAAFADATGIEVRTGGLEDALSSEGAPERAIIATDILQLHPQVLALLNAGTREILVEKPAALNSSELAEQVELAERKGAKVFIAYNRRFFASAIEARRLIAEDGGLLSVTFDFTEIAEKSDRPGRAEAIKNRWVIANSAHVIDLAFNLAGDPEEWQPMQAGTMAWHPSASVFAGAGRTDQGTLFAYSANWSGPGRWGVELVTAKRRIILRPMERIQVVDAPMAEPEYPDISYEYDTLYKPGLYRQVEAFFAGDETHLCSIAEQQRRVEQIEAIAGYSER